MAARALAAIDDGWNMAAADLNRVLAAIEAGRKENGEAIATLKIEVAYMVNGLKDLTGKVDRMDDAKAGRVEVQAVELRLKEVIAESKASSVVSVAQVKAEAAYMVAQNNSALNTRLDMISAQMETLQTTVKDLEHVRWWVTGTAAAVGAGAAIGLPWLGKLFFHG